MQLSPLAISIGVTVCLIGGIVVYSGDSNDKPIAITEKAMPPSNSVKSIPSESAEDSTKSEDVATLIAKFQSQNAENELLKSKIKNLETKYSNNALLKNSEDSSKFDKYTNDIDDKLENLNKAITDKTNYIETKLAQIQQRNTDKTEDFEYTKNSQPSNNFQILPNPIPSDLVNEEKDDERYDTFESTSYNNWTLPSDAELNVPKSSNEKPTIEFALNKSEVFKRNTGTTFNANIANLNDELTASESNNNVQKEVDKVIRFGTIPQEATLIDAVTMTALLGRIPVKGKLTDPFEFKVLVGSTNLATNGIRIPHLKSMELRGIAKGNYTGQCVEGDIVAGTYTFDDGRIQSFTSESIGTDGASDYETSGQVVANRIGWISTNTGIPCLSGEYISDSESFIALQGGLAAISGIASGYAAAAQEVTGSGDSQNAVVTKPGQFALGTGANKAVESAVGWINDMRSSASAMIYVRPNQKVAINITKAIPIDYHSSARKVSYLNDWSIKSEQTNLD